MSCCTESVSLVLNNSISSIELLVLMFITGLAGSFTHCIGMCGPIALGQMSMRLMHISKDQMNQRNKILCAASIPYYVGKAITYSILAIGWYFLSSLLIKKYIFKVIITSLMIGAATFFILNALNIHIVFLQKKFSSIPLIKRISLFFINISNHLKLNLYGLKGWILGMILGLIPCGLVYSSIITSVSYSDSFLIAGISLFLFGMGTIPGLFMISYLGEYVLIKWKNFFSFVYAISLLFNAYLLINAIL